MTTITTTPVLYVVLARDRGPSGTSTTSLLIRALNDDGGAVLGCYLSPFDAMMDMVRKDNPDCEYRSIRLDSLRPQDLRAAFPAGVSLEVLCGFRAKDAQLLDSQQSPLVSYRLQRDIRLQLNQDELCIDFPDDVLREINHLHEGVGLFAWQETAQRISTTWKQAQITHTMHSAFHKANHVRGLVPSDADQIGLFDPEAENWHFVPYIPLEILKRPPNRRR
ncbi:MAG: hypothetical protein QM625_03815 [Ralstonia sp.]|jgi:hypothetical protein|uniref:Uncharacterized protein n=4 Tax=Pseudomonadota TaxID=1224 RepID=A0A2P4RGR0_RALPI|nr:MULTISPECIES: hypothetical protein [Ralstonia]MBA4202486.1 hypothetical protein [Ralstonia sp.]MBA4233157.1 hypothetical protein [Ralstonia sp.]MBA4238834.1 hypothetical protein [Ralstonia sp.]MBA4282538.1 hypothetical protein [Ralstonia sp.]MBA4297407.1 hypothetical protein [Ralstonia sp.]